jgi:hypothetical protein
MAEKPIEARNDLSNCSIENIEGYLRAIEFQLHEMRKLLTAQNDEEFGTNGRH